MVRYSYSVLGNWTTRSRPFVRSVERKKHAFSQDAANVSMSMLMSISISMVIIQQTRRGGGRGRGGAEGTED